MQVASIIASGPLLDLFYALHDARCALQNQPWPFFPARVTSGTTKHCPPSLQRVCAEATCMRVVHAFPCRLPLGRPRARCPRTQRCARPPRQLGPSTPATRGRSCIGGARPREWSIWCPRPRRRSPASPAMVAAPTVVPHVPICQAGQCYTVCALNSAQAGVREAISEAVRKARGFKPGVLKPSALLLVNILQASSRMLARKLKRAIPAAKQVLASARFSSRQPGLSSSASVNLDRNCCKPSPRCSAIKLHSSMSTQTSPAGKFRRIELKKYIPGDRPAQKLQSRPHLHPCSTCRTLCT
jgi:hypothetical protein